VEPRRAKHAEHAGKHPGLTPVPIHIAAVRQGGGPTSELVEGCRGANEAMKGASTSFSSRIAGRSSRSGAQEGRGVSTGQVDLNWM
jgi:hypothetical protein